MPVAFIPAIELPDPGPGTVWRMAWGKVGRMDIIEMASKKKARG